MFPPTVATSASATASVSCDSSTCFAAEIRSAARLSRRTAIAIASAAFDFRVAAALTARSASLMAAAVVATACACSLHAASRRLSHSCILTIVSFSFPFRFMASSRSAPASMRALSRRAVSSFTSDSRFAFVSVRAFTCVSSSDSRVLYCWILPSSTSALPTEAMKADSVSLDFGGLEDSSDRSLFSISCAATRSALNAADRASVACLSTQRACDVRFNC